MLSPNSPNNLRIWVLIHHSMGLNALRSVRVSQGAAVNDDHRPTHLSVSSSILCQYDIDVSKATYSPQVW